MLFDIRETNIAIEYIPKFIGIIAILLGFSLLWKGNPRAPARYLGMAGCLVFLLYFSGDCLGRYKLRAELSQQLASSSCETVEGVVTSFTPLPANGHGSERFAIGKVVFQYSGGSTPPAFSVSSYPRGAIKKGECLRVDYLSESGKRPVILRIQRCAAAAGDDEAR